MRRNLGALVLVGLAACSALVDTSGLAGGGPGAEITDGGAVGDAAAAPADAGVSSVGDGGDAGPAPCVPSDVIETLVAVPRVAVDDPRIGTVAWNAPGNATAKDNAFATTATMDGEVITHWLLTSDYGLAVPPRSLIRGFVVVVSRAAGFPDEIGDEGVALVQRGSPGVPKSLPGAWPKTVAQATYGSRSDTWGQSWSAEDVASAEFGVAIAARGLPAYSEEARVDYVEVTVHFSQCR